jgi:hypothetical protein
MKPNDEERFEAIKHEKQGTLFHGAEGLFESSNSQKGVLECLVGVADIGPFHH